MSKLRSRRLLPNTDRAVGVLDYTLEVFGDELRAWYFDALALQTV